MAGERNRRPHWTVDRRVPLALVVTILVQTAGVVGAGVWYAAQYENRLTAAENSILSAQSSLSAQAERLVVLQARQASAETAAARLEERIKAQGHTLTRIEQLVRDIARAAHARQ